MTKSMTREEARKYFAGKIKPEYLEGFLDKVFSGQSLLSEERQKQRAEEIKPLLEAWERSGRIPKK